MELSVQQKNILDKAIQGHSMVILGQSGTGKSSLSKAIATELKKCEVKVQITATTGIASLNVGGKTIHSWSGISDGRYSNDILLSKLENNDNFAIYRNNILNTTCLIIDEISMLSKKLFEQLEYICRNLKNKSIIFGGMQVIAVGDFFQLAPVPDELKDDRGEYCFMSPLFLKIFCHKFILNDVLRQQEPDFIKAVNDVSKGELPTDTCNLLRRLKRTLPPGDEPIRLSARNFDCFIYNACKLMDMPGREYVFNAIDDGNIRKLENIPAPKGLHIKLGCPVMLLKNLSDQLVNGLRGVVHSVTDDIISVIFSVPNSDKTIFTELKRESFCLYSSVDDRVIASRKQFPICLSFSITIHKAQGLTLKRVEVDASNIFAPGQLGVAIGRATAKKGLRIVGFNPSSVFKHDQTLYEYYNECSVPSNFDDSLGCCKQVFVDENILNDSEYIDRDLEEVLSDFSDAELQEIDFLLSNDSEYFEIITADDDGDTTNNEIFVNIDELSGVFSGENASIKDTQIRLRFENLIADKPHSVEIFANKLYMKMIDLFMSNLGNVETKNTQPNEWTQFYSGLYTFSISNEYTDLVKKLLSIDSPSGNDFEMCAKVFDHVKSMVIKKNTEHLLKRHTSTSVTPKELSDSVNGKLRYIFGRCVAKARYHNMKYAKNNMYNKMHKDTVTKSFIKVKMLDSLSSTFVELNETSRYKKSLHETKRRQNISQSLINITDNVFEFTLKLEEKRLLVEHEKNFHLYGSEFLSHCHSCLLKDTILYNSWKTLFKNFEYSDTIFGIRIELADACVRELYNDLINRYCKIADNQFRKDLLHNVGRQKKDRLRKRVDIKSAKPVKEVLSNTSSVSISDETPGPSKKHHETPSSTKPSSSKKSSSLSTNSKTRLKKRKSNSLSKRKNARKKTSKKESETVCPLCKSVYDDGEDWIACDLCDKWFDRRCLQLTESQWQELQENDWFCPKCLN